NAGRQEQVIAPVAVEVANPILAVGLDPESVSRLLDWVGDVVAGSGIAVLLDGVAWLPCANTLRATTAPTEGLPRTLMALPLVYWNAFSRISKNSPASPQPYW